MTSEQWRWLLLEGLTPLFGAGAIFALWGACKWVATADKQRFGYAWEESLDAMGWLYGALVIAMQSATRFSNATTPQTFGTAYELLGGVWCLGLLLNGMDKRSQSRRWYPPNSVKVLSIVLSIAILAGGCYARGLGQRLSPANTHSLRS
jgi:hypothetical protein